MKNVLIISASPRKHGNSDTLCDYFAKGAQESGNHVEKIFLAEKNIGYCTGCGVCNETHLCVQKDDMKEILDKMGNSRCHCVCNTRLLLFHEWENEKLH